MLFQQVEEILKQLGDCHDEELGFMYCIRVGRLWFCGPNLAHHLLLSIKFYWNTDPPVNFDIVLSVFTIQWQS